ncbi:MAG: iron-sulfur cluster assembly scaffold protein [archaeon]
MPDEIYTEIILDLYKNPVNRGSVPNPDLRFSGGNPTCGDAVVFEIKLGDDGKTIAEIKFSGHGCAISTAAESLLTQNVKGKTIEEAIALTNKDVFAWLGNIIQTRVKCALLGLHVLKEGLKEYEASGNRKVEGIRI